VCYLDELDGSHRVMARSEGFPGAKIADSELVTGVF
jgi:hypothetical protein